MIHKGCVALISAWWLMLVHSSNWDPIAPRRPATESSRLIHRMTVSWQIIAVMASDGLSSPGQIVMVLWRYQNRACVPCSDSHDFFDTYDEASLLLRFDFYCEDCYGNFEEYFLGRTTSGEFHELNEVMFWVRSAFNRMADHELEDVLRCL